MNQNTLDSIVVDLSQTIDAIYSVYLDGSAGFSRFAQTLAEAQAATMRQLSVTNPALATMEYLDSLGFAYGTGHPQDPKTVIQHMTTQGEIRARNREGGRNHVFLANMCIVTIYQFWEEHFREPLAMALGVSKADLKVPVFGDLRRLRNAIVHNLGIATLDVNKCEVLQWFKSGDRIEPTKLQVRSMVEALYEYVDSLPANKVPHPAAAPWPTLELRQEE